MRWWADTLLALAGIRVEISGMQHVHPGEASIYMANHTSILDILVLISALPVDLRFIFKKSLLWAPVVGQAIYLMGMIPIDRSGGNKAHESLKKAGLQIKKGKHILVFPEGTRTRTGRLASFKKGGFILALQQAIPIVPISINNSRNLCGRNSIWAKKGTVSVFIHARVDTGNYRIANRNQLVAEVRATIASGLHETAQAAV